jgi:hypothetical protein
MPTTYTTTRTPADDLADQLTREGYPPVIKAFAGGAHVSLFNNRILGLPQAQGDSIYDALDAARRHRDSMISEDGGKKYCKPGVLPIANGKGG